MPEQSDESMMPGVRQLVLALLGQPNGPRIIRRRGAPHKHAVKWP
jgi:hypothetical protein